MGIIGKIFGTIFIILGLIILGASVINIFTLGKVLTILAALGLSSTNFWFAWVFNTAVGFILLIWGVFLFRD